MGGGLGMRMKIKLYITAVPVTVKQFIKHHHYFLNLKLSRSSCI
jgi:cyclophilin family peptidyl-prolyl cis-trans isomerase